MTVRARCTGFLYIKPLYHYNDGVLCWGSVWLSHAMKQVIENGCYGQTSSLRTFCSTRQLFVYKYVPSLSPAYFLCNAIIREQLFKHFLWAAWNAAYPFLPLVGGEASSLHG